MRSIERNIKICNVNIYSITHLPKNKITKGVIIFVHGLGDHSRRYDDWFRFFVDQNWIVFSYDQRGHGRSQGKRGVVSSYDLYLHDLDFMIDRIKEKYIGQRIVLYGHSMGGNIVLNYLLDYPKTDIYRVIVTSPWLKLGRNNIIFLTKIAKYVSKLLPYLQLKSGIKSEDLSDVTNFDEKREKDKFTHNKIGVKLFYEAQVRAQKVLKYPKTISVPILLLHGGKDKISLPHETYLFARKQINATYIEWADAKHHLHNYEKSDDVAQYIKVWLNQE